MYAPVAYEPRGKVKDLLDAMDQTTATKPVWTVDDVAKHMEVGKSQVHAYLVAARTRGALFARLDNGVTQFSRKPFTPPTPAPEPGTLAGWPPRGSVAPTPAPTEAPAPRETPKPTNAPTPKPTPAPTPSPTPAATPAPTKAPEPELPIPRLAAEPVAAPATQADQPVLTTEEYVRRIQPDTARAPRAFNAWLSSGDALLLQGLELDEDGDAMLAPKHVEQLRRLLGAQA